jgi:hypothetical protein
MSENIRIKFNDYVYKVNPFIHKYFENDNTDLFLDNIHLLQYNKIKLEDKLIE